jgi:hypothetical protein
VLTCRAGACEATRQRESRTVLQLADRDVVRQVWRDNAQTADNFGGADRPEERDRFHPCRIRHRMQQSGQTGDVVGVRVGDANRAEPAEAPSDSAPGDLRPLAGPALPRRDQASWPARIAVGTVYRVQLTFGRYCAKR